MKIRDLLENASAGATSSGSVAGVAMPFFTHGTPTVLRRNDPTPDQKPKKGRKRRRNTSQV